MSPARPEAGFSLVELLLSLALTGLIMAMTLPFADVQKRLWERGEERREARRALTGALAWMARDLEQSGYHDPGPPLRRVDPESISYVVSRDERDPAGFSPANRRLITVWLDAGDLKYKIQAPLEPPASGWERGSTQVLASGLGGMHCRALDGEGAETPSAAEAALVECALTASDGRGERLVVRPGARGREGSP
jgi:type II secretory pathway component PulJ